MYNIGLEFVWRKQQECNLRKITKQRKTDVIILEDKIFCKNVREELTNELLLG